MDEKRKRGRMAILVIPLLVCFAAASKIGDKVRTVDFLQIFAAGVLFGVVMMSIIQMVRESKKSAA